MAFVLILTSNEEVHRILEIIHYQVHDNERKVLYVKELYLICTISGLFTFGCALYNKLTINLGLKLVIIAFFIGKILLF